MRSLITAFALILASVPMAFAKEIDPENTLYLDLKDGRVTIEMYPEFAPETVKRIKTLVREGFYDGIVFHRVIEGFMAQTGDPKGDGTGGSQYPDLPDEFNIKRHWRGITSMANSGVPNSANSQFFIMFADNRNLDGKYTVWGRVIDGMKHVDKIKRGDPYNNGAVSAPPDRIVKMVVAADADPVEPAQEEESAAAVETPMKKPEAEGEAESSNPNEL